MNLITELIPFVKKITSEEHLIPAVRQELLQRLSTYIMDRKRAGEAVKLNFICTHNSRRSHLAQIMAATAAAYYEVEKVATYSGGTEATAFNPRAVAALRRAGFQIADGAGTNPPYLVTYAVNLPPLTCFSKIYDHADNPQQNFGAVMTCSEADEKCPFIPGAGLRLPLTYDDPKIADDTPQEAERYDERVQQIGRELFYALSLVANS